MLSMMLNTSSGGICCRIECSTRSQRRAVSSMRVPVGAAKMKLELPASTRGEEVLAQPRNDACANDTRQAAKNRQQEKRGDGAGNAPAARW